MAAKCDVGGILNISFYEVVLSGAPYGESTLQNNCDIMST